LPVVLNLELVVERVALPHNRPVNDMSVELQFLAVPRIRVRHDLIHVLVVLRALREGRPQQADEGCRQYDSRDADLGCFARHTWGLVLRGYSCMFSRSTLDWLG